MQFNIEVIQVQEKKNLKNAKGGVYNAVAVAYNKDGKVEGKEFPDWANKDIYSALLALKPGDVKTITTEKNSGGFWQWYAIEDAPIEVAGKSSGASTSASNAKAGTGKVLGSNYETKEERAARQVLIVRQSSLSNAIAFVAATSAKGKPDLSVQGIIGIAKEFETYVLAQPKQEQDLFADLEDDVPQ